jgi:hypothetical protein
MILLLKLNFSCRLYSVLLALIHMECGLQRLAVEVKLSKSRFTASCWLFVVICYDRP